MMGTSLSMQVTGYVDSDPQVRQVGEQRCLATAPLPRSRKPG